MIWLDLAVRDNDGRKLDHQTLEVLRVRAVEQVKAGAHPEQVAQVLGLHRKTVYGWLAKYPEGHRQLVEFRAVDGRVEPGFEHRVDLWSGARAAAVAVPVIWFQVVGR